MAAAATPDDESAEALLGQGQALVQSSRPDQARVVTGGGVAGAGPDAQTEQVGQPAQVAAGGFGLVEDTVLADRGDGQGRAGVLRTCLVLEGDTP